ncbi:MAG TPA: 2-C-methyl-D-erythritol 4-phosphate cytidylyltransferase [bacterium]|nr:2-C-methyl-D-erythritol 4-phosphate cytidylyltransferase [bacterium]
MVCVGIVVAGGKGRRMATKVSKQYLDLGGRPILARTLEALSAAPIVNALVLVVPRGDVVFCKDQIVEKYNLAKVARVVMGGQTRQESVARGLRAIEKLRLTPDVVLVHDGVRPFIEPQIIERAARIAANFGAALVAGAVKETIKLITDDGFVRQTPDRRWLVSAQTPQAFQYDTLLDAHREAEKTGFVGTDDCQLVERIGGRVIVVNGEDTNVKITTQTDLLLAQAIWKQRNKR